MQSCCVVTINQEHTKLCDFSNTNNNDFIGTPLAPPATSAETCDINTTLLNLVMKDQFSDTPNEDAASHLNTFLELCDMQKKKYVDNDVVKMKLFPFLCVILQKFGSLLCLAIVSILGISAKMILSLSIFLAQKLFPLEPRSSISSNLNMSMLHNLGKG